MTEQNLGDKLMPRALAILEGHFHVWHKHRPYHVGGFDRTKETLNYYIHSDTHVQYWRSGDPKGSVAFIDVRPAADVEVLRDESRVLSSEVQHSISVRPRGIIKAETQRHRFMFGDRLLDEEVQEHEFTVAIRNMFRAGNELTPVGNETELSIATRNAWNSRRVTEQITEEEIEREVLVEPGDRIEYYLTRSVDHMEREMEVQGDVDHIIRLGEYHHRKWFGLAQYEKVEHFLRCARCLAPDSWALTSHFKACRDNDKYAEVAQAIENVEKPLAYRFTFTKEMDGVSGYEPGQRSMA